MAIWSDVRRACGEDYASSGPGISVPYSIASPGGRLAEIPAPVLVLHDEDGTRERALAELRAAGHEVLGFSDPTTALDAIEATSRVRVVVTRIDFGEGKLNGVALARMLKVKRLGVKMVFVARPENLDYAVDLGERLPMPLDTQALVEAVTRLLSQPEDGSRP